MENQPNERSVGSAKTGMALIIGAVAIWGAFHAVGTYLSGNTADWRKPTLVLACTFSFLAFWGCLLYFRGRRS